MPLRPNSNVSYECNSLRKCGRKAKWNPTFQSLEPRMLLAADVLITELVASNRQSLDDGNGRSPDWIELYNAGDEAADLTGWYLSDDLENLDRWQFSAIQLEPNQYLVIVASGTNLPNYVDQDGFHHANFKLSSSGETLALVRPDQSIARQIEFPRQFTDVSYGLVSPSFEQAGFFAEPTPGAENGIAKSAVSEASVAMSKESGVFSNSFSVQLTTTANEAAIVYTLDGSVPDEASAIYTEALQIAASTQVRARVMETDRILGPDQDE